MKVIKSHIIASYQILYNPHYILINQFTGTNYLSSPNHPFNYPNLHDDVRFQIVLNQSKLIFLNIVDMDTSSKQQ